MLAINFNGSNVKNNKINEDLKPSETMKKKI